MKKAGSPCPACSRSYCAEYAELGKPAQWKCACGAGGMLDEEGFTIRPPAVKPTTRSPIKPPWRQPKAAGLSISAPQGELAGIAAELARIRTHISKLRVALLARDVAEVERLIKEWEDGGRQPKAAAQSTTRGDFDDGILTVDDILFGDWFAPHQ